MHLVQDAVGRALTGEVGEAYVEIGRERCVEGRRQGGRRRHDERRDVGHPQRGRPLAAGEHLEGGRHGDPGERPQGRTRDHALRGRLEQRPDHHEIGLGREDLVRDERAELSGHVLVGAHRLDVRSEPVGIEHLAMQDARGGAHHQERDAQDGQRARQDPHGPTIAGRCGGGRHNSDGGPEELR